MSDGIKALVEGVVERTFQRGARLKIRRESQDGERRWVDYITVWDLFGVKKGDIVKVNGELSYRLTFYEGRPQVDASLNSPTGLEMIQSADESVSADGEPVGAGWGA